MIRISKSLFSTMSRLSFNSVKSIDNLVSSTKALKPIASAGILIIGDEVLNGKILDTNSYNFARFCFNNLSIPMKRTIVCGDDSQDIKNSLKILVEQDKLDIIITSGGLGSTHDDITYSVLSEFYGIDYELDQEVVDRMKKIRGQYLDQLSPDQLSAFYKMATLPTSKSPNVTTEKIFIDDSLWFPIVAINQQVYILPGVPQLFTKLVSALESYLKTRISLSGSQLHRFYVKTTSAESEMAPLLSNLQEKVDSKYGTGIVKLGSYPHMDWKINTVSIIGKIPEVSKEALRAVVDEVVAGIGGNATEISQQDEDKMSNESPSGAKI
ncbi:putative molybdopterin binding protein [Scheffersomyces xylosifermentans]|uniref:putative molybdopterin binding protein n=1 Tax=Scheffersomyces xylosifermentans TaxID=1304137 RepID=UPI00315D1BB5